MFRQMDICRIDQLIGVGLQCGQLRHPVIGVIRQEASCKRKRNGGIAGKGDR